MGFEPTLGYKPKHAFQACALNHSATSPLKYFSYLEQRTVARLYPERSEVSSP